MKKISVFQVTLLAIFGALAVASVLIFSFAIGGGGASATGPVVIWGTLNQNAFSAVIRAAAENDKQFSQVTYVQKDASTYDADLTNALAAGGGPDLYLVRQDDAYVQSSRLIPIPYTSLSQSQFQNTFVDAASPFLSIGGVLGVPLAVDPMVLYWNRDLLGAAGYSQAPQYWDELYGMAQKITKRDDAGNVLKSTIAFGEYANIANAKDILSMLILQAGGSITTTDSSGRLVSALQPRTGVSNQATASALRFYTEFADPSKLDYSWNQSLPEAEQAFSSGELALYLGYASDEPLISRMNPNLNFAVAPVPQVRGAATAIDVGRVYAFAIPKTSKNPSGAVTIAYLLDSTANSKALWTALGIPSARRDVLNQPVQGDDELFRKQAIIARSWTDPDPAKTADLFRAMIEDTVSGAALLTDAVGRADQEMGHILGQ